MQTSPKQQETNCTRESNRKPVAPPVKLDILVVSVDFVAAAATFAKGENLGSEGRAMSIIMSESPAMSIITFRLTRDRAAGR